MEKITENDIELYAIEELENLGYSYIYGPDIAPDTDAQERYMEILSKYNWRVFIIIIIRKRLFVTATRWP